MEFFEPQQRRMSLNGRGGPPLPPTTLASSMAGPPGSASKSRATSASAAMPAEEEVELQLSADDVKVYLVDPRDPQPSLRELSDIYREHVELQKEAVKRVAVVEKEMDILLETRMKELSANEMEVWVFDT